MTKRERTVQVKLLPPSLNEEVGRTFMREIESCMDISHCWMVLDCSGIRQFDRAVVYLLLCCLEAAMKHSGEIRLASLPTGAEAILEHAGASHLFDIYDTTAHAVRSFQQLPAAARAQVFKTAPIANHSENRSRPA
ncbi:MAG TPA: STAS domain-containing protein [Acidobacteriaceae bacterium]|nr:STAS domain-containing protein [Acidobacteriaceae bacterium]